MIEEHTRIYEDWHHAARDRNTPALLSLYADDAVLETPLVTAVLEDKPEGILRGRAELERFFIEGSRRRPNDLVRWFRTGRAYSKGDTLVWEYPRQTPSGDQVDIAEFIKIRDGLIRHHRIYWGWFGFQLLLESSKRKWSARV